MTPKVKTEEALTVAWKRIAELEAEVAQLCSAYDYAGKCCAREAEVARLRAAASQAIRIKHAARGVYGAILDDLRAALAKGGGDGG